MNNFLDTMKEMAEQANVSAHPLVDKLNANQITRSSYWLAFALYAKIEEEELDTQLTELGKSLKLDDYEIEEVLSTVNECADDDEFESLVQECVSGLCDQTAKILLLMELEQFSKENSLKPDFISVLADVIELSPDEKNFLKELKEILNEETPDIEKFSAFLAKNVDKSSIIFNLYCPDLYKAASTIPNGAAYFLIQEIIDKTVSGKSPDSIPLRFAPEMLHVPEKMADVDKKIKEKYPQTVLALVRNSAFSLYKERIIKLFSDFEEWINHLNSENEGLGWPFDAVIDQNRTLRWYFQYHMGVKKFEIEDTLFLGIENGSEDAIALDRVMGGLFACLGSKAEDKHEEEVKQRINYRKEALVKARAFFENELKEMEKHFS